MITVEFIAVCIVAWAIGHNIPLPDSEKESSLFFVDWLIILFAVGALVVLFLTKH